MEHEVFMAQALALAREAFQAGEVPVGCVIVKDGAVIGRGRNRREERQDPLAHAELLAIQEASRVLGDCQIVDRLFDTILRRDVAQLSRNGQIDRETVADLALQLVATVQRMELHAFERNAILHYSTMIR